MCGQRGGVLGAQTKFEKFDEGPYGWVSLEYLEIRCHTSPQRKSDKKMKIETPGCTNLVLPIKQKIKKDQHFVLRELD